MENIFILPEFDSNFWVAAIIITIAGMVRGFAGFGSALIMVPILALLYSLVFAVICVIIVVMDGINHPSVR